MPACARVAPTPGSTTAAAQHFRPSRSRGAKGAHDDFPAHRGPRRRHRGSPLLGTLGLTRVRARSQGPSNRRREARRRVRPRAPRSRPATPVTQLHSKVKVRGRFPAQGAGDRRNHQSRCDQGRGRLDRHRRRPSSSSRAGSSRADAQVDARAEQHRGARRLLPDHDLASTPIRPLGGQVRAGNRGRKSWRSPPRRTRPARAPATAKVIARNLLVTTVQIDGVPRADARRQATAAQRNRPGNCS